MMSALRPPSTPRVVVILARAALRRFGNRMRAQKLGGRKDAKKSEDSAKPAKRGGTARKSRGGKLILGFFGLLFLWNGVFMASRLVARLAGEVELRTGAESGQVVVSLSIYAGLTALQAGAEDVERRDQLAREIRAMASGESTSEPTPVNLDEYWDQFLDPEDLLATTFRQLIKSSGDPEEPSVEVIISAIRDRGMDAFVARRRLTSFPDPDRWPSEAAQPRFLAALALLYLLLWVSLVAMELGSANQDLGRVEWTLEWLFTFPVRGRSLFLAQILQYASLYVFAWFTVFPLTIAVLVIGGWGWWAPVGALAATAYTNILLAAVRQLVEVFFRKRLSPARKKTLQAVFTVVGILTLYIVLAAASMDKVPDWLFQAVDRVPLGAEYLPSSFPALLALGGGTAVLACVGMGFLAAAVLFVAPLLAERLVRDGLVASSGGAYRGERGRRATRAPGRSFLGRGVTGKELRHLLRDRNFFVQVLVVPLLVIGFQLFIFGGWVAAASGSFQSAAILAFGIGAFVVMGGGFSALTSEGEALWLLYSFPRRMDEILRGKAIVWAIVGGIYAVAVLIVFGVRSELAAVDIASAVMAVAGVAICAVIATGLGVLGTDPFQKITQRRSRPTHAYVYMLLASMYGYGMYASDSWAKLQTVAVCGMIAVAIWERVRDQAPYLLDPVREPPRRLRFSAAMIAVIVYLTLQKLAGTVIALASPGAAGATAWEHVSYASLVAGTCVVVATLVWLARSSIPGVFTQVGLRLRSGGVALVAEAIIVGVLGGLVAGAGAYGWHFLWPWMWAHDIERNIPPDAWGWVVVRCVLLAPLFEEFINRGLLFASLRQSRSLRFAVFVSAAIFAVTHSAYSFVPVFGLGVAAALTFERTKLLLAPFVTHAVYNLIVLWLARFG